MATGHIDAGKLDERVKVLELAEASPGVWVGGGKFEPDARVTRQQAVTMLYRYAVKIADIRTDERAELGRFTDSAKINAYAITAMRWAVGSGR